MRRRLAVHDSGTHGAGRAAQRGAAAVYTHACIHCKRGGSTGDATPAGAAGAAAAARFARRRRGAQRRPVRGMQRRAWRRLIHVLHCVRGGGSRLIHTRARRGHAVAATRTVS